MAHFACKQVICFYMSFAIICYVVFFVCVFSSQYWLFLPTLDTQAGTSITIYKSWSILFVKYCTTSAFVYFKFSFLIILLFSNYNTSTFVLPPFITHLLLHFLLASVIYFHFISCILHFLLVTNFNFLKFNFTLKPFGFKVIKTIWFSGY